MPKVTGVAGRRLPGGLHLQLGSLVGRLGLGSGRLGRQLPGLNLGLVLGHLGHGGLAVALRQLAAAKTAAGRQHAAAGFAVGHFGRQAVPRSLASGRLGQLAGTTRTEELGGVLGQQGRRGEHRVVRGVILSGGGDQGVGVLQLLPQLLGIGGQLQGLLGLAQQGVLDDAGVVVQ